MKKKVKRPSRIAFVLVSLITVIAIALNTFIWGFASPLFGFLDNILNAQSVKTTAEAIAATEASAALTERVAEEGIILLKNNGALPMANAKVNVFGAGSVNFTYGGSGSGAGDESKNIGLYQGLQNAGIETNSELLSFYEANVQTTGGAEMIGYVGSDFNIYEPDAALFTDSLIDSAKAFSDTALIVISRVGGEGMDLPYDMTGVLGGDEGKHYLELSDAEKAMVEIVESNFENVIFILNSPNAMELGFLEDDNADAALWVGADGSTGANAIGEILLGIVNPSGRTTDTFPYAVESHPSYWNFGAYDYDNVTYTNTAMFGNKAEDHYHYVEYVEGIYVGYRYFETAAADGFIKYEDVVQFPFGYGLSYTNFEKEFVSFGNDDTTITADVRITNTGSVAGKEVVQLYYTAPYTPGGIEKSEVVLAAFGKTGELQPGESQTMTLSFAVEDMASYDYAGEKAYVLDAGEYTISLRNNSHDEIDSRTITISEHTVYSGENKRSTDLIAAENQFDDVSFGDDLVYVSRSDWEGTMPASRGAASKSATAEQVALLTGTHYTVEDAEDITFKKHGLKLADMKGLEYDDPKWNDLLEQLSVKDMTTLVGTGGWCTVKLWSIQKPHLVDCDGPNGINNLLAGTQGNQFAAQSLLGCTWNTELAEEVGMALANEAKSYKIAGIYAPAINTHRNPFAGRNYEYYSEDGLLAGKMVASEIRGIYSQGVYAYVKHFAVNDQETNRDMGGLATWLNEQAMREIYLKPFELAVKEGHATGIMSSFNRIGAVPAAESYPLLTTVLRDEWGFKGMVITDCVMSCTTQDVNGALRAGNDLELTLLEQLKMNSDTTNTASGRQALRRASHNILFTIANSDALETRTMALYNWEIGILVSQILVFGLIALYYVRRHKKMKAWKAQQSNTMAE